MQNDPKRSVLTLEDQSKLVLSGVERVDSFSEREIRLVVNGKRVRIEGSKLKVLAFSEGSGNFSAGGSVESIRFSQGAKAVSRFFK